MFDRVEKLIGIEKLDLIKTKTVLLIGLGGVGGSAFETLVRSGVQNIIIIDFDNVDISNLNRQVLYNLDSIGKKKVDVAENFCKSINKDCCVKKYDIFLNEENIKTLFDDNDIDYVIDACDSLNTKKSIILECLKRKVKFISSMGTANKLDPSKLIITDIRKTKSDPIAKILRKWVKDMKINDKIMVVSTEEVPIKKGKVLSTMSFVPNTAGILAANYVIRDIIKI